MNKWQGWEVEECGTIVGIRSVGVGERQLEDSFVGFGAKPTQRACARDFLRVRKKTRKGSQQIVVSDSQGKATAREKQLLKWGVGTYGPRSQVSSVRGWVSVFGSCVGISFGYMLAIATKFQKSAKTSPFLRLGLTQARSCLFFFLPLSVIYVISVVYL